MKRSRVFYFSLIAILICVVFSTFEVKARNAKGYSNFCVVGNAGSEDVRIVKTPTDGGIRETVADKYRERYERWKKELLSTAFGREQWDSYAANKSFILTIKISSSEGQGAGTTDYQWNENGDLVGATILLGSKIDRGYPNPIYFPVVNSLSAKEPLYKISHNILAAAKFAHEFGHINQTAKTGGEVFRQQNKLILEYNEIFRASGYAIKDERLVELQKQLGGTPVDVWANREYWGEANAMSYLVERVGKEEFYCSVINKIENNIKTFASDYEDRFLKLIELSDTCRN